MRLYDNDAYREQFAELVYDLLGSDDTNDRANQIIDVFDMAPEVEATPLPPNHPLTLEQLREMGGEAVWVESLEGIRKSGFGIVHLCPPPSLGVVRKIWIFGGGSEFWQDIPWPRSKKRQEYGKRWIAYRRKPEEEET